MADSEYYPTTTVVAQRVPPIAQLEPSDAAPPALQPENDKRLPGTFSVA